jgi:hypothetical protein
MISSALIITHPVSKKGKRALLAVESGIIVVFIAREGIDADGVKASMKLGARASSQIWDCSQARVNVRCGASLYVRKSAEYASEKLEVRLL